jgi:hypothetical protein
MSVPPFPAVPIRPRTHWRAPALLLTLVACGRDPDIRAINQAAPEAHRLVEAGRCAEARALLIRVGGPKMKPGADVLYARCMAQRAGAPP